MVEQLTLNQRVVGSSPTRFTTSSGLSFVFSSLTPAAGDLEGRLAVYSNYAIIHWIELVL